MRHNLFATAALALALISSHAIVAAPGAKNHRVTAPAPRSPQHAQLATAVDVAVKASVALSVFFGAVNGG